MLAKIRNAFQELERTGLDTLAAIIPWIAPIPTAYITFGNAQAHLGFNEPMAWVTAAIAECLGLVTIHTSYSLYIHSKTSADEGGGPTLIAVASAGFYLAIIIMVNVILEIGYTDAVKIMAKALIALISVVSGVILALRTRHASRLVAAAQAAQAQAQAQARAAAQAHEREVIERTIEDRKLELASIERRADKDAERAYKLELAKIKLAAASSGQASLTTGQTTPATGRTTGQRRAASLSSGQNGPASGRPVDKTGQASGHDGQVQAIRDVKHFREIMAQAVNGERPTGADDLTARFGVARTTARRWWSDYTAAQAVAPASAPPDATAA